MNFLNKNKKNYTYLLFLIFLLPFIYSIYKSVPSADDFSILQNNKSNLINVIYIEYMTWNGKWLASLFQRLITPITMKNFNLYGLALAFIFLFFVFTLMNLLNEISIFLYGRENKISKYSITLLILLLLNYAEYHQVFYWINASVYSLAIAFGFLGISYSIRTLITSKTKYCAMASIFGFISCNYFFDATFPGLIVFLLIIYDYWKNKKINKKLVIILFVMVISGIIAAIAPGNFARKSAVSGSVSILTCLIYGMFDSIISLINIFKNPITIFIAIFSYYIGYKNEKNVVTYKPINVVLISLAIIIINSYLLCLPIAIGYSGIGGFQNRTEFMTEIPIVVEIIAACFCIGNCFKVHGLLKFDKKDKRILLIVLALFFYATEISSDKYKSLPSFEICENIVRIDQTNKFWINTFNDLKNHKNEDVIVYVNDYVENCPVLNTPCITEDKDNWVNVAVADYFGLKSVTVVTKE